MLKNLMLLALAVGALVAFAAPATASANLLWETGEEPLGSNKEEGDAVHFTGTLSMTRGALKISCSATATANLWNDETLGAHGEVTSLAIGSDPTGTAGCTVGVNPGIGTYIDVTECHVETAANGLPRTVTSSEEAEGNHQIMIEDYAYTTAYKGAGCLQHLGIPSGTPLSYTGNVTGSIEGKCIVFDSSLTTGGNAIDGELCADGDLRLTTEE